MKTKRTDTGSTWPLWDAAHPWNRAVAHSDWREEKHRRLWQACGETAIHEAGHALVAARHDEVG